MSQIKFTIIIPHKNIPDLLARCVESIPKRMDIQVIIVDDNSDPEKRELNRFSDLRNNSVEVIYTKEGKGAGYARNIGIKHAKGEWLLFADADDYFCTENINALFNITLPDDCEVVSWQYCRVDHTGHNIKSFKQKAYNNDVVLVKCDDVMYQFDNCTPWVRMVKTDLIRRNNILFEEVPVSNDVMFAAKIAVSIDHYYFYNAVCYYYVQRNQSLMTLHSVEKIKVREEVEIRVYEFLKKHGKSISYNGGYGNWLAQVHYPTFFKTFCKDIINYGFVNAYRRYSISCHKKESPISMIPYYTYLKRKLKKVFFRK